jgi:hypothetical protein
MMSGRRGQSKDFLELPGNDTMSEMQVVRVGVDESSIADDESYLEINKGYGDNSSASGSCMIRQINNDASS